MWEREIIIEFNISRTFTISPPNPHCIFHFRLHSAAAHLTKKLQSELYTDLVSSGEVSEAGHPAGDFAHHRDRAVPVKASSDVICHGHVHEAAAGLVNHPSKSAELGSVACV